MEISDLESYLIVQKDRFLETRLWLKNLINCGVNKALDQSVFFTTVGYIQKLGVNSDCYKNRLVGFKKCLTVVISSCHTTHLIYFQTVKIIFASEKKNYFKFLFNRNCHDQYCGIYSEILSLIYKWEKNLVYNLFFIYLCQYCLNLWQHFRATFVNL